MKFNKVLLRNVARAWGLQPSYLVQGKPAIWAPEKTLLKVLQDLTRTTISSDADLKTLLQKRREKYLHDGIEKSLVFWGGQSHAFSLYFPLEKMPSAVKIEARLGDGSNRDVHYEILEERKYGDHRRIRIQLKDTFPLGYHTLSILTSDREFRSLLICPPERLETAKNLAHSWGPFIPLYALRSGDEWGVGSLKEFKEAAQICHQYGAKWAGTLPLLAVNLDPVDCDPSPYSALTRLFWNEIFLDVEEIVEKYNHSAARELIRSTEFQNELKALRDTKYVDYHRVYQLKKRVLKMISQDFFAQKKHEESAYKNFVKENPEIDGYASFRSPKVDEQNFHRFVQFEMNEALRKLSEQSPIGLYLDFPVGVNDAGYDFQAFNSVFFKEVSVGAPPEEVFQQGQDWGFPSFHPLRHRDEGYEYLRKSLRNHLKYCKILRMDHVMGLYRVYCVPKGFTGHDGIYLRFPPEDLFAIAMLEAYQAKADVIGENLGTVPEAVGEILTRRNLNGMWVLQMETWRKPQEVFNPVPPNALASFNTHDMPMWAQYCKGDDLLLVRDLKILNPDSYAEFLKNRKKTIAEWEQYFGKDAMTTKLHESLAKTGAKYFVVTLEDLWSEEEPQNIPGTWKEYPNWRRKYALRMNQWTKHSQALDIFEILKKNR